MTDEDRSRAVITEGRNPDGTFAPGNPGRRKGSRHRASRAIEELMDGEGEALTRKAIDLALEGDTVALRLCLERIAPPRKDVPVAFDLPTMVTAQDAAKASAAILEAVSLGSLTPLEGTAVMGLVEQFRRSLEASEFEARLSVLEGKR